MAPLSTIPVHFLQWNSRSITPKKPELIDLINTNKIVVAAISETWLRSGSMFRIPGFSCLRDDRDDGRAGSALLIKRNLPFSQITLPSHTDDINAVAAKIMDINFISIYIPHPNISLIPDLSTILLSVPPPLVIMGDFNCHNISWGSLYTDSFSPLLLDLFEDINVCILNDSSPTHRVYPGQNQQSVLDLTACSPNLASLLSWRILDQSYGSDHFPIIVSKPCSVLPSPIFEPLLKYKILEADWQKYTELIEIRLLEPESLLSSSNLLEQYSHFLSIMNESADQAIPKRKPAGQKIASPPWWDSDCTAAIKERNSAEQIYNKSPNINNFINFKKVTARTKRLLSKTKKKGWKGFCASLAPRTPSSIVWKNIKKFRGSFIPDPVSSCDSSLWLDDFIDRLAPAFVPMDLYSSPLPPLTCTDPLDQPFTITELKLSLEGLRNSSPGEDGVPYIFLCKLGPIGQGYLLQLLNNFFISGIVPESWKRQIIIPIPKPNKNVHEANSYRPIALSSTVGKILERMVKNRLEWFIENKRILSKTQFGFRKGKSTMDSLGIFTSDIHLALSKNKNLFACFLDVAAAYDSVQLPLLRAKLLQLSISARIVCFICNLFMGRTIRIKLGNTYSAPRTLWQGIPQGSVLSPLLYNIYTHDLDQSVSPFCEVLQYADDLVLYTSTECAETASSRLNEALSYLVDWMDEHGLTLSPSKSCAVTFTRRKTIPIVDVSCLDEVIPNCESFKFLGVILDSKMTGIPHLNYIIGKCEKGINVMRSLSGVWWGSHPICQKLLYNALIRSQIDYGSFILEPCSKLALKKVDLIQAKCLRIILGAMKSSPKNAMQVECLEPPLFLRRQYLADRFIFKIASLSSHPLLPRLEALAREVSENRYWFHKETPRIVQSYLKFQDLPFSAYQYEINPLFKTDFKALINIPEVLLDFGIIKNDPVAQNKFTALMEEWKEFLPVYTDASKLSEEGCVGAAVWIPRFNVLLNYKCPPKTSVFTGETLAILEAIAYVESHNIPKTIIFSDCKSCLQAIAGNPFKTKINFPLVLQIKELLLKSKLRGLDIALAWIPGHNGIEGNECADFWAKNAINMGSLDYSNYYLTDLLATARSDARSTWQDLWDSSRLSKGRHYGNIQPNIPTKPWFFRFKFVDKKTTSTICRLRLGHVCTPVFLAKIRVRDHSLCECGLDEGTTDHIFFSCSKFSYSLYDVLPPEIPRPINFQSLLCYLNSSHMNLLIKYIHQNEIKL